MKKGIKVNERTFYYMLSNVRCARFFISKMAVVVFLLKHIHKFHIFC